MFLKCLFLLLFCCLFEYTQSRYNTYTSRCPLPENVRVTQQRKFFKFSCAPRYTLVGNKYATCSRFSRQWDVPVPVCVKSGCETLEEVKNAVNQTSHNDAWIMFFCMPRHTLVGSPVLFCDGNSWNSTAPMCIDSSARPKTSCDFDDGLCGWIQDESHDFDWRRLNRKTPSSYMKTGPTYDHTLGPNGTGYFMYIEGSSRLVNDTARLLSPVYDESLANDGCFVFYYHMFGADIGGLRVYQKPDSITLYDLIHYSENGRNKYLLFDEWGNRGDYWFTGVSRLMNVSEDFQIVIEGIRGPSFVSDIAIDDVSILQGQNCTNFLEHASTPPPKNYDPESCVDRCGIKVSDPGACSCDPYACYMDNSCCRDYLDVCLFGPDNSDTESTSEELPQTQKLVASSPVTTTINTTTTSPTTQTTTLRLSTTTTLRPTTTARPTTTSTLRTTTTSRPTTNRTIRPKPIRTSPTTRLTTTTTRTTPTTTRTTTRTSVTTTTPRATTRQNFTTLWPRTTIFHIVTANTADNISLPSTLADGTKKSGSNGILTAVIVLLAIGVCCGMLYGGYVLRSSRGSAALARLRGRATRDPEVRFLKSEDIDDE